MQLGLKMKPFNAHVVQVQKMTEKTNSHGFKTPNDYLESMERQLLDRIDEINLPRHHGLSTPLHYFEQIEDRILSRVSDESREIKVVPFYAKHWIPWVSGMAACLVAGFFIWNQISVPAEVFADNEISTYIENGTLGVESQDLAQLLTAADIEELALEADFLTDENLDDYIIEHLDESNLYQE